MCPDIPTFKVRVFRSDLKFEIQVNWFVVDMYSYSNFSSSFDFHCLYQLWKRYQFVVDGFSICGLSIYTLRSDQWITMWWAKFELECLLLYSFTSMKNKFKVTCKNGDFECQHIRTQKRQRIQALHSPYCSFPIKMLELNCHSDSYFRIYISWWNRQIRFKMVYSSRIEFVIHKYVTHTIPIWVAFIFKRRLLYPPAYTYSQAQHLQLVKKRIPDFSNYPVLHYLMNNYIYECCHYIWIIIVRKKKEKKSGQIGKSYF